MDSNMDNKVFVTCIQKAQSNTLEMKESESKTILGDLLQPPFAETNLHTWVEACSTLYKCIKIIQTNTCGFGYRLEPETVFLEELERLENKEEIEDYILEQELVTKAILDNSNPKKTITDVLEQVVADGKTYGYAGIEVVFNSTGERFTLINVPVQELYITNRDDEYTEFINYYDGREFKDSWKFRRYAQCQTTKKVYYKDLLDPRDIDKDTGEIYKAGELPENQRANPLIFLEFGIKSNNPYPKPEFLPVARDILGNIYAKKVNSDYFQNGLMVDMVMILEDGMLTKTGEAELKKIFSDAKGVDNAHKLFVLQSMGNPKKVGDDKTETANSKIRFEKLPAFDKTDGQFLDYIKQTDRNISSVYGLPSLYFGIEESYNKATSEKIAKVTEQQEFSSVRTKLESMVNLLLNIVGRPNFKFRLNTPNISDYADYPQIIKEFRELGIIPVDNMIRIWDEITNDDVGSIENGDKPYYQWKLLNDAKFIDSVKDDENKDKESGEVGFIRIQDNEVSEEIEKKEEEGDAD